MEEFFVQYAAQYAPYKPGGVWCYEDGCIYRGLEALHAATGDDVWKDHLLRMISRQISDDGVLLGYAPDEFNIDNILAGRVLFSLTETPDDKYSKALDSLAGQLQRHPRTAGGNYWHKLVYPHQVWLDGLYMGLPFQIEYGQLRGRPELIEDAISQMLRATGLMRDRVTGLYFHGIDEAREQSWADPKTGLSPSFWSRAMGWQAMALSDSADLLDERHPRRAEVIQCAEDLADAILDRRTDDNLWLQVMDQPNLKDNYEETSSSAMFAYALLKLASVSENGQQYADAGHEALSSLEANYVGRGDNGEWQLRQVCEVAGLGSLGGRNRDGSPEYYVSEARVANDAKGVGPLMMAHAISLAQPNIVARTRGQMAG